MVKELLLGKDALVAVNEGKEEGGGGRSQIIRRGGAMQGISDGGEKGAVEEGHELPPLRSGKGRDPIIRDDEAELNGDIQLMRRKFGLRGELSCSLAE